MTGIPANASDRKPVLNLSSVIYNGTLYEQVYNPKTSQSSFIGWDTNKQELIAIDYLEDSDFKYAPINDELLQKGAVLLPSDAIDYGNEEELEIEIESYLQTWVDVSEEHLQKAVWYAFLTRLTDNINTIPYLRALGDTGTGKTRYLDTIGGICYKPMFVGGAVNSAPIFRIIDKWRGTAIFDEFNLKKSDDSENIIQILNNGYQRGKPVLRCQDGNYENVKPFDAFCPKILATRDRFRDKALESRCLTEILTTTSRNDIPIDLTQKFFDKRGELQNKLLMYRFKHWDTVDTDAMINIDFGENVLPRIKQAHAPFTVLFLDNKERLSEFIRYTQKVNNKIIEENSMSFEGQIINAYIHLLEEHEMEQQTLDDHKEPVITSTDVKDHLVNVEGWDADKLKTSTIGRKIRTLGFGVTPKSIAGKTKRVITIDDDKLEKLKQKYVITTITDITLHTDEVINDKLSD